MLNLSVYDYLIIIFYFLIILFIGFKTRESDSSALEYIVAGRTLTLPAFVATLVSTFYGGILGIGEFTFNYGISSWLLNAFPYYFFILLFALFLAKRIRKTNLYTIPDKLEIVYGRKVSITGAVFVFFLVTPAPYILMLGIIVQLIFGWSLEISMSACLILSVIYLYKGGLRADVRVNVAEFILMFLGFGIILPFCFYNIGGFYYLQENLPPLYLNITGGNSLQFILVWFFIGAWAIVDPSFHQRCYAAKSEKVARNGVLISLIFWFIFDFLTTTTGLYAKAYLKELENPAMSYPVFADQILPSIAKGFFFIGLIATIMSTLHSFIFISATTLGNDIINKIKKIPCNDNFYSKIGLIITSLVSLIIAVLIPSVVEIWYSIGSLFIPALLISIVSSYFNKLVIGKNFIFISMITSFAVSTAAYIYGQVNFSEGYPVYIFELEPLYPGLFFGILIYIIGFIKKRYFEASYR